MLFFGINGCIFSPMKYFVFIMGLFFSVAVFPFAGTLKDTFPGLDAGQISTLQGKGEITRYFYTGEIPAFLFKTPFSDQIVREIRNRDINIGVESVYFVKTEKEIPLLTIYNTLLSIHTMEGIQYYSRTRKKYRTLYTKSTVIAGKKDPTPLRDPEVTVLPAVKQLYIEQTDTTFGKNIYKTTYKTEGKVIWVEMTNETPFYFSFIRMVKKGDISINLLITKTDTGLVFYGITSAKTISFFGIERKNKESFYNRMKALYTWFVHQMNP